MCMLAVFNSEHDVGDDKDVSSKVAKRKTCCEFNIIASQHNYVGALR